MARLQWLLNDKERASGEVRQLLSLCDEPGVGDAERREARELAKGMGVEPPPPRAAPREQRPQRGGWDDQRPARGPRDDRRPPMVRDDTGPPYGRPPRPQRDLRPAYDGPARDAAPRESRVDAVRRARELALTGHWREALEALPRGRDPEAVLLRSWAHLEAALAGPAEGREAAMTAVAADLRRALDLPRADGVRPERAERAERPARPAKAADGAERPSRVEAEVADANLASALRSGDGAQIEAALGAFQRGWRAVTSAEGALGEAAPGAIVALVQRVVGSERMPEATTLLVKAAVAGDAAAEALLAASENLGGAGIADVVRLARVATDAGLGFSRVLRGLTARERRDHAALDALADRTGGLWRLLVRKGDQRGELWFVAQGDAELWAAVPILLLDNRFRTVCLGASVDGAAWAATGGPAPCVDDAALAEALAAWS